MEKTKKRLLAGAILSLIAIAVVTFCLFFILKSQDEQLSIATHSREDIYNAVCTDSSEMKKDLCQALSEQNVKFDLSGHEITFSSRLTDGSATTYDIDTGKVVKLCGFWVGFAMQSSRCATPEELEEARKNR